MRLILHDANKFKFKQDLLWIGISTLATIIIWILYSVYVAFTTPTVDQEINKLLSPINPILDKDTLAQLEDVYFPPEEYTILIKQEVGESIRIVPLGTDVPREIDDENTDDSPDSSSTDEDSEDETDQNQPSPTPTTLP